jgi:hypothetical protein
LRGDFWDIGHVPYFGSNAPLSSTIGEWFMTSAPTRSSLIIAPRKHLIREFDDCVDFAIRHISLDGLAIPASQREWKIGQTFSWHYVKIVEYRIAQMSAEMDTLMARSKGKSKPESDFGKYEFVRCELSAEDKKSAKIWIDENTTQLGAMLHDAVASDYKFSLSFSSEHDTFTACLTGKPDCAANPFKILTSRHKDWISAALSVLYKHAVIFKSGVWEDDTPDSDDGWA